MAKETRKAVRAKHDSVLEIRDERGRLLDSVTRLVDVSSTGARFRSTLVFRRDERITARLRLMKEGVLDVTAHVIWVENDSNANLYGIAFDSVTPLKQQ